jgi:glycosyltransferase involved in cell wall biosynthesis
MRIGLVSTLATRVQPVGSGSVEGIVWMLARELSGLGHEVTVFAAHGSEADGRVLSALHSPYGANGEPGDWQVCEWINLCHAVEHSQDLDILHSHAYLYGLPLQALSRAPMVHTMHMMGGEEFARLWRAFPTAHVSAISRAQWAAYPDLQPEAVIHHGVDQTQFSFRADPDDYVCFLGRFMSGKGPLAAIHAARELGVRLLLAGPVNEYFQQVIAPLVDGRTVEYVGTVSGLRRDALLGGARALLYPLRSAEPFGLVLPEAMMCGTPVAALRIGAVSEIVDEGLTGCCSDSAEDFVGAIRRSFDLDRRKVREHAEVRFSASRMAREYEALYMREVETASEGAERAGING